MKKYNEDEIDDYVLNRMIASERKNFEAVLESNRALQGEVALRKKFIKVAKVKGRIKAVHEAMMKNQGARIADVENKPTGISKEQSISVITPQNKNIRRGEPATASTSQNKSIKGGKLKTTSESTTSVISINYKKWLSYAASIALLIASPFFYAATNLSNNTLASKNAKNILSTEISNNKSGNRNNDTTPNQNPLNEGLRHLNKSELTNKLELDNAAKSFKSIPADNEAYTKARLYLAYTNYHLDDYNEAIKNANKVIEKSIDNGEKQKAEWIILLSKLEAENLDDAFYEKLEEISKNDHHNYNAKAKQLKDDLNTFWRRFIVF